MKQLFTLTAGLMLAAGLAHTAAAQDVDKWQFYFEAGPKISQFRTMSAGGHYFPQSNSQSYSEADRQITVRNTFSGFMDVKAFKPLSKHLVLSGTVGLDMQHLNYRTGFSQVGNNGSITAYGSQHISRLLTRARADFGLHYQIQLGESGRLLPGVTIGQMVNLSQNGYSYTFIQPGLYFTNDRLLLSATVSDTPYNVLIPGASHFEGVLNGPYTYNAEYRIRELQLSIGTKF